MILPIMALVLLHFYVTISKNFQISVFLRGGLPVSSAGGLSPRRGTDPLHWRLVTPSSQIVHNERHYPKREANKC